MKYLRKEKGCQMESKGLSTFHNIYFLNHLLNSYVTWLVIKIETEEF